MNIQDNSQIHVSEITIIAKGAGVVFLGSIFWGTAIFFFNIYIARVLGPSSYGLYSLGLAIFNILSILSLAGMNNGLIRFVSLYKGENDQARIKGTLLTGIGVVVLVSISIGALLLIFADAISIRVFQKENLSAVLKLFAIALPFYSIMAIFNSSIQGFQLMKYLVYVRNLFEPSARIFIVTFLFLIGLRLNGVVFAQIIAIALAAYFGYYFLRRVSPLHNKTIKPVFEVKKLLMFSLPLLFVWFLQMGIKRTDRLLLGYFRSSEEVGIYNAACQTVILIMMIIESFNTIFAPMISDLYNRHEHLKLEYLFKTVTKWIFTVTVPIFLLIFFFSKEILGLFGEKFFLGAVCLKILALAQLINSVTGSVGYMLIMSGHPKIEFFNTLGIFIMEISCGLILIPKYGTVGAAVAIGISLSIINIIRILEVLLILKIHPYRIDFLKPLLSGLGAIIILFLMTKYLSDTINHLILLIIGSLVLFVIYAFILFKLGLEDEDKIILYKIKSLALSLFEKSGR